VALLVAVLRDSEGGAVLASEADIEASLFDPAWIGLHVEPTSAQPNLGDSRRAEDIARGWRNPPGGNDAGAHRLRPEGPTSVAALMDMTL
jgi:hypothetical protein